MTEEIKLEISDMDAQTLKHLESRMVDVKKILALHAEGFDAKTVASKLRVAVSYTQHIIDISDVNKIQDELLRQYGTPHLKTVVEKAKAKIVEAKAKEPAIVGTAYPNKKSDEPVTAIKPLKTEKLPKVEKKKSDVTPVKSSGGTNSRHVAILEVLKTSPGMTKEEIGKAVNIKLGINRNSWDTPMYELKKAGLVDYDPQTKLYQIHGGK